MNDLLNTLQSFDQDQAIVALFAAVLVCCGVAAIAVALLRALGRWGRVALFLAVAAVLIGFRLTN